MADCDDIEGKCAEVRTEVLDLASNLACEDLTENESKVFYGYIIAASLLELLCVMNKIAQKVYPLGDAVAPDEPLTPLSSYWMGGMPVDFNLCDLVFYRQSTTGGSGGVGSGSGSGSGSCTSLLFNVKITTPENEEILIFDDFIEVQEKCGKVIEGELSSFSEDFKDINKIIPSCSRIDIITGECVAGYGLRVDLLGTLSTC